MAPSKGRTPSRSRPPTDSKRRETKPPLAEPGIASDREDEDDRHLPDHAVLFRLMTWLSPAFPVGAFSYSSGIEWAVEAGDIVDAETLKHWLTSMLRDGPGFCDGILLCHAWRACTERHDDALAEVAELANAFTPSRERHLETTAQGRAFAEIARATWPCEALDRLQAISPGPLAYPVAVGAVSAGHGVRLDPTLHAFLHAQTSNWISAGVRLIPLGQTDSQRVLAALEPTIAETAQRTLTATLDDLGSATFRADLASMRHETQYTRLFRS
jgi:urease accessory protein